MNPNQNSQTQRPNAVMITKVTNGFVVYDNTKTGKTSTSISSDIAGLLQIVSGIFSAPVEDEK